MFSHEDEPKKIGEQEKKIESKKDFSNITSAYNFFMAHSDEYEANKFQVTKKLEQEKLLKQNVSIFDFGGGDGEFLFDLYTKTTLNKLNPRLYLFDPVETYQEIAKIKLASIGYNNLTVLKKIDDCSESTFDLILVKHVLYYVENLEQIMSRLISKLNKNGQLWILMADNNNSLIKLWMIFFEKLGMKVPYFLITDLKQFLERESIEYVEKKAIKSNFHFKNSLENRHKMIHFLLGNYSSRLEDITVEKVISDYEKNNEINFPLAIVY